MIEDYIPRTRKFLEVKTFIENFFELLKGNIKDIRDAKDLYDVRELYELLKDIHKNKKDLIRMSIQLADDYDLNNISKDISKVLISARKLEILIENKICEIIVKIDKDKIKGEHGEIGTGIHKNERWCEICSKWHKVYYICKHYPIKLLTNLGEENGILNKEEDARWCNRCNLFHGTLYECRFYSQHILDQIRKEKNKYKDTLDWHDDGYMNL